MEGYGSAETSPTLLWQVILDAFHKRSLMSNFVEARLIVPALWEAQRTSRNIFSWCLIKAI